LYFRCTAAKNNTIEPAGSIISDLLKINACSFGDLRQDDMRPNFSRFAAVVALVGAFWVVPSVGSRGESTLDDNVVHVDAALLADSSASRPALQRADQMVIRAVAGL
jgi:hypothetical protein